MFGSPAASRSLLRVRRILIGLQIALLVFSLAAPAGAFAADPSGSPDPSPSGMPSADPSPSADPTATPAPDPTATPAPDPTATPAPDPTAPPAPDPTAAPDPTPDPTAVPDPTATPDPSPAVTLSPYIVTFVAGTPAAAQSDAIAAAGATDLDSIAVLRMHAVSASDAEAAALRVDASVASVELDRSRAAEAAPDDSSYADQWSLPRIGWDQVHGFVTPTGSAVVAVLDTGVDASHPDIDDSLVGGASFVAGSAWNADPNGHGTAMAGIVAAETGNGTGIAGVGFAGVKVMPVTVLGPNGLGRDSDIIEGLVWAADHDADVALLAFSASGYSSALQAAVDYAWSQGVVVVAATGNDGSSAPTFPAGDRGVVGVSSVDASDSLTSSSNYGTAVFLAAPGDGIVTLAAGGGVTSVSGTSAAAAEVAGAAALLRAVDPTLLAGAIVGRLARSADAAGTVDQTGNGRLNLARALADVATDEVQPAGAAPVGDGGPFVGPYVAAANNDAHVAPGWAPTNTTVTFSSLYRKTTGGTVQHVRVTLPVGYTNISVTATAFSSGSWGVPTVNQVARTVDVALASGTGLATNNVDWARIDVTATTPVANQTGNAAEWLIQTFTNAAGTTGEQNDNPPVLIGVITNPSATIQVVDAGGTVVPNPVLQNGIATTLRVRITQSGSGIKYTDLAVPTCFSAPSGIVISNPGGNPYTAPIVTDGFIRLSGGDITTNGTLTFTFTTTPNCVSGTYTVATDPSTNATNPPSGTNQSVSTTGGTITVAAGLANLSITKTDTPDPVASGGTLTYTIGVHNAGPDDAAAVKVVDTLPAGVTFVSATGTNWACGNVAGTVTCNRTGGNLPAGADAPNITVTVTAGSAGLITNSATVSSPNDNTPANNTAAATTLVQNPVDMSITKTDGVTSVNAGDGVVRTYTITVTNNGPSNATNGVLADVWPVGFTRGTITAPAGATCSDTGSGPSFSCLLGAMAAGTSKVVTVTYTVPASTVGTKSNTVCAGSVGTFEVNSANDCAIDSNTVISTGTVSGTKFQDDNADGVNTADPADPGLSGWTIRAYSDNGSGGGTANDGILQAGETTISGTTTTNASGAWSLALAAGNYVVCEVSQVTWFQSTPSNTKCSAISGLATGGFAVAVTAGGTFAGRDFGNYQRGTVFGSKFRDDDGDGARNGAEPTLDGWVIRAYADNGAGGGTAGDGILQAGETSSPASATTASGLYGLSLNPGAYVICEVSQAGWGQTAPANAKCAAIAGAGPGGIAVTVSSGITSSNNAFGNQARGSISGFKFNDKDRSGGFNAGDTKLTGWTIQLCADSGCTAGNVLQTTTTNVSGDYSFTNLAPGTYFVREFDQAGWVRNVPAAGFHQVVVGTAAPTTSTANDFGNRSVALAVDKEFSDASVIAGSTGHTFTIAVTNSGSSDAIGVHVTDSVDSRLLVTNASGPAAGVCSATTVQFVDCTFDVPAGATRTVTVTYSVDASAGATASLLNQATATDIDANTASDTDDVAITSDVSLSLTKTFSPSTVTAGDGNHTFTIQVTNTGTFSTAHNLSITDSVDPRLVVTAVSESVDNNCGVASQNVSCSVASLAAGQTATVTVTYHVSTDASAATVDNTATANSDEVPTGDQGSASLTIVTVADLSITKSDGVSTVTAGDAIVRTYTITVHNDGPSDAQGVSVSDTWPLGFTRGTLTPSQGTGCTGAPSFTCALGTIAAGADATITVTHTVPPDTTASPQNNTASVTATTTDPDTANNSATDSNTVETSADLEIAKTDDTGSVTAGTSTTYTITITNHGPSTVPAGIVVTDSIPAGTTGSETEADCSISAGVVTCTTTTALAPGASFDYDVTVAVPSGFAGATLSNTASIFSSPVSDPTPGNNSSTDTDTVTRSADLEIQKTGVPNEFAGNDLTWQIKVTNHGPSDNAGFTVEDVLPAGVSFVEATSPACDFASGTVTCTSAGLAAGASVMWDITVHISAAFVPGDLVNTAEITDTDTADGNGANDIDSATTAITRSADVADLKTVSSPIVIAGTSFFYTVTVTNNGPSDAIDVILTDTLNAALLNETFTVEAGPSAPWTGSTNLGTIAAGQTVTVKITATVNPSTPDGTVIANTATADSPVDDPNGANNTSSVNTTIDTEADLGASKAGPATAVAGDPDGFDYTITVHNYGPSDNTGGFTVSDTLPAGLTFIAADSDSDCSAAGQVVTCTNTAGLAYGADDTFIVHATLASTIDGGVVLHNQASVATEGTVDPLAANNSSVVVNTTVVEDVDLQVVKTFADASVVAGTSSHTFTISVTNAGLSDADDLELTDLVDAWLGLNIVDQTGSGLDCSGSLDQLILCVADHLAAGATATITVTYSVAASTAPATVSNTADASSDEDSASGTDSVDITTSANLLVTKTAASDPVIAGTDEVYTIKVTNHGPSDNAGFTLTDAIPAGTTFVSATSPACVLSGATVTCTSTGLAVGATVTWTITVAVSSTHAGGTTLSNTASIATTATPDPISGNDSSTETVTVNREADLEITKTDEWAANDHDPVIAGTDGAYLLTIVNHGPSSSSGFTATDTLPAGFTFTTVGSDAACAAGASNSVVCSLTSDLAAGATATFVVAYSSDPAIPDGAVLTDIATVAGVDTDPISLNDSDSEDTTVIARADLSITKTGSPDPVLAGNVLTYTITVSNGGPSDAQAVSVADTLPAELTAITVSSSQGGCSAFPCLLGTIPASGSATITVTATVAANTPDDTTLSNTAVVSSATTDPDGTDNSATATTHVDAEADLEITKTDSPDPVLAGNVLTYTITVSNGGPSDAQAVSVADTLPAELTSITVSPSQGTCSGFPCLLGTISAGGSATITVTATVASGTSATAVLSNTATVSSSTTDPDASNNSDTETTDVDRSADVSDLKVASPDPVIAGNSLIYMVTVSNGGPSDADNVSLVDTLPAGVSNARFCVVIPVTFPCTDEADFTPYTSGDEIGLGTIAAGTSKVVKIRVDVDSDVANGETLTNTAVVSSDEPDPNTANNTASATVDVIAEADLSITKTDGETTVTAGDGVTYTYTITVSNGGPSDAQAVSANDTWPAGFDRGTVTPSQGTCDLTDPADFSCDLGVIAAGGDATITVAYTVPSTTDSGSQTNSAFVSSTTTDPDPSDNSSSDTNTVVEDVVLTTTKVFNSPTVTAGGASQTFTISVTNSGASDADNVHVLDSVDGDLVVGSISGDFGCGASSGQDVDCSLAHLGANATAAITVTYSVDTTTEARTGVANEATTASDEDAADPAGDTVDIVEEVILDVTKTFDSATVTAGGASQTFTISVTNTGASEADNLSLTDSVPSSLVVDSISVANFACDPPSQTISCSLDHLGSGISKSITVTYHVASTTDSTAAVGNTAFATADDSGADSDTDTVEIVEDVSLAVTKTFNSATVTAGGASQTFTISVKNDGVSDADNLVVSDSVDGRLVVSALTSATLTCLAPSQAISCSAAHLGAGVTATITVTFGVAATTDSDPAVPNTASAKSDEAGPTSSAATSVAIVEDVSLAVTKSFIDDPATAGTSGHTFTISVKNTGVSDADNVALTDTVDPRLVVTGIAAGAFTCAGPSQSISCTLGHLGAGATATITVTYSAASVAATTVSNTGSAVSDEQTTAATGTDTVAIAQRTTQTTVTCPANLAVNQSGTCAIQVDDTDAGTKSNPTGTATASLDGISVSGATGSFPGGATCTLTAILADPDSSSCTVTYLPGSTAGNHVVKGVYDEASSGLHATSSGTATILVRLRTTSTTVTCAPSVVLQTGTQMTCTVTVVDTDAAGTKLSPTGTVTVTRDGGLAINCTLAATLSDRSACSVQFTSATAQVWVIAAAYSGSSKHATSSTIEPLIVVFYDPAGGFVTGGGYIRHEQSTTNPNTLGVAGKDNFGFNAKYLKGASVPTGETEFQCKVCNLNFHSTAYDWLVITKLSPSTVKAQYQGSGTVNGVAGYGFLVTVIDGGQTDTARIRIWSKSSGTVLYDNEFGQFDSTNPTTVTAGGNIVVHDK